MKRVQKAEKACLEFPGWKLIKDEHRGFLKCDGRIKGYRTTYLSGRRLAEKLSVHKHNQVMHLGTANTMSSVRKLVDAEVDS